MVVHVVDVLSDSPTSRSFVDHDVELGFVSALRLKGEGVPWSQKNDILEVD